MHLTIMSSISECFWREGLHMDSSIFSDDDFFDWRWPASSPRRCDRASSAAAHGVLGMDIHSSHANHAAARPSSCSCSSSPSSSSNLEELFLYCTEELGSESTSGVGKNLYKHENEYTSSLISAQSQLPPQASSSGRCTYDDHNWAFKQQACLASSSWFNSTSHNSKSEDAYASSRNVSSRTRTLYINAPHHHHHHRDSDTESAGENRAFPPPIASLLTDRPLMRSFKSNGRFVLKKVDNVSRSLFRSTRENGHLRLDLLSCSFERLESWYGLFYPASVSMSSASQDVSPASEIVSTSSFRHNRDPNIPYPYHWFRSPSPYDSILHHKPTLTAIAALMRPKGTCSPLVEESISTSFQVEQLIKGESGGNAAAMVQSRPHVFALLKLLPSGALGLIIFEISQLKGRPGHVTMYGMYIPKDCGFECGSASMSPGHHLLTDRCVVSSTDPKKGRLSPFEDCKRERNMKGVFAQYPLF